MKVLYVTYHADVRFGGLVRSVPGLALAASKVPGVSVELVAIVRGEEADFDPAFFEVGGTVLRATGPRGVCDLLVLRTLRREVRRFDLVAVHGIWAPHSCAASVSAALAGRPYVTNVHGSLAKWALGRKRLRKKLYWWAMERRSMNRAACVRALTVAEANDCRRAGVERPICVIPNGINTDSEADPSEFLKKWPHLGQHRMVLFLGRLAENKGPTLLCEAWREVWFRHKEARLIIAGPDADGTERVLRRRVAELGISNSVVFVGPVYGMLKASLLNAAEVFVLPSRSEGFSMAILEAMAAGLAVIATRECNVDDIVMTRGGVLVERTRSDLAEALDSVLSKSTAELRLWGRRNREHAVSAYSWSRIGAQAVDMYRWALGGPRPTSCPVY